MKKSSVKRLFLILLLATAPSPLHAVVPGPGILWEEVAKLNESDSGPGHHFGDSVALSGDVALIGADQDIENGSQSGAAYLFDITTGTEMAKLLPEDGDLNDFFGGSVAISDDIALVGAIGDDDNGLSSGSAYLFDVTTGNQLAKLLPLDGAANDFFGLSVGVWGDVAIVGAYRNDDHGTDSGSAYLFDVPSGTQLAKLTALDAAAADRFGYSVAIWGDVAIVGAYQDNDFGRDSGSAYLFDVTTGTQLAKLTPLDGSADDLFGSSVAIWEDVAIVGAVWDEDNEAFSGSAYLFDVTTGTQLAKLLPSDGDLDDNFGHSVTIYGDYAIVGAVLDEPKGEHSGSAYVFDVKTGTQLAKLTASDGASGDRFGNSVALWDDVAVVGAFLDNNPDPNEGSAYVFKRLPEPGAGVLLVIGTLVPMWFRRRAAHSKR